MKRSFWVMVLVAGAATAGPPTRGIEPVEVPDASIAAQDIPAPFAEERALIDALRMNDFRAFIEAKKSPIAAARMEQDWKETQLEIAAKEEEAKSDPEYLEMQAIWTKLQTPAGVDALVAEWHPKLAEQAKSKVTEFNLGLAMMLTSIAQDRDMPLEQSMMMRDLVLAVQKWANDTDFDDPQRLRRAIDAIAVEARRSGLEAPVDLFALPLDEALARGDGALRAAKSALAAYDLHVDAVLDSIRITEVERHGVDATVRFEARVLGVNLAHTQEMRWFHGNWMVADSARSMEAWEREHAEEIAAARRTESLAEPDEREQPGAER